MFAIEKTGIDDAWTPFKELQNFIERYVVSASTTHDPQYHEFMETLRNHRQNFLSLLKNQVNFIFISYLGYCLYFFVKFEPSKIFLTKKIQLIYLVERWRKKRENLVLDVK